MFQGPPVVGTSALNQQTGTKQTIASGTTNCSWGDTRQQGFIIVWPDKGMFSFPYVWAIFPWLFLVLYLLFVFIDVWSDFKIFPSNHNTSTTTPLLFVQGSGCGELCLDSGTDSDKNSFFGSDPIGEVQLTRKSSPVLVPSVLQSASVTSAFSPSIHPYSGYKWIWCQDPSSLCCRFQPE